MLVELYPVFWLFCALAMIAGVAILIASQL